MSSTTFFSNHQNENGTINNNNNNSTIDIILSLSQSLNAGITDPNAAQALLALTRSGVNPETLTALVLELRSRREEAMAVVDRR
mmetsp:Transcript_23827/g.28118  ORF Transcript_23827/g.28118 Transcript_23827/m.28118 type:complete len:84 (-) Transcript_23827:67-318(-)|eukprot:CAMPEP_0198276988 /NCGR_PEP_ID=MMETSP1447-20131203/65609_1 /TAXON_ID=420782 /ORGANISM="Chaetoceros dichaeta, Strain CCMP1751" /LENGTH=83 /DNA_ID=CAMNT_0043971977 /DNA_START=46 /DNA_END=297 /DNA_ORIENTATION=-